MSPQWKNRHVVAEGYLPGCSRCQVRLCQIATLALIKLRNETAMRGQNGTIYLDGIKRPFDKAARALLSCATVYTKGPCERVRARTRSHDHGERAANAATPEIPEGVRVLCCARRIYYTSSVWVVHL
jgi:hypothetical protein